MMIKYIKEKSLKVIWIVAMLLCIGLILFPVNSRLIRVMLIVVTAVIWAGILIAAWKIRMIRYSILILTAVIVFSLLLPGSRPDINTLRNKYVSIMASYEGVYYFWGGENKIGIDCSGLVRRGLYEAYINLGIKKLNPAMIRSGLSLWWHDCSARAFLNGCSGQAVPLFNAPSINTLDLNRLMPGDFAVTTDGIHMLAYLGDNIWIEADPGQRKVIKVKVPARNNFWFNHPVLLMRWRQLWQSDSDSNSL